MASVLGSVGLGAVFDNLEFIPVTDIQSGCSPLTRSQLSPAPETGIRNFQILSSETLTPGRFRSVYQMLNAAAETNASQVKEKYQAKGKGPPWNPSAGMEIR